MQDAETLRHGPTYPVRGESTFDWHSRRMSERRRNLWPLPGGVGSYATNLQILVKSVGRGISRSDLEGLVADLAPTVRSPSTVRGYAAVPVTLGLIERSDATRLFLTEAGRRYARSGSRGILRASLVERVLGVEELLQELSTGTATCPELSERLADLGISWNYPMAVRYRLWWLVSAGAIEAVRDSRVDRLSLTRAGQQLVNQRGSLGVTPAATAQHEIAQGLAREVRSS